jgi:hypothetical protein
MTTKTEMILTLKAENPNGLRTGSDEAGYSNLSDAEYETKIAEWADARLAKEAKLAEAEALAQSKIETVEKLIALGIDPKALGL